MGDITIMVIEYAARTAVLTLLLWLMVKLQKLDYFFLGLLGSATLACALDTIPYFGHYLAVPVLYFCIWKVTQASLVPDAIFTVVIAYALMFAVKVLLFTALIGDLRPSIRGDESDEGYLAVAVETPSSPVAVQPQATNQKLSAASPAKAAAKSADEILKNIIVKGVTQNGGKSMLLISANKKNYTLVLGTLTLVQMPNEVCHIRLVNVSETWATVEVNGEAAYLRIR